MTVVPRERRRQPRRTGVQEHGFSHARIRPGHPATIVDLSADGILVDTPHRVLPGASVEVLLTRDGKGDAEAVRGRVVRCSVVRLRAEAVTYRAAIAFGQSVASLVSPG